jgi:hypothetical protein
MMLARMGDRVMRGLLISLGGVVMATLLSGCYHSREFPDYGELPPDYSPRYTTMSIVTPSGKEKRVIVPEACLTPEPDSEAEMGVSRIPPGCANNWNTLRMAERKGDVMRGRRMDKAPGATVSRAAQRYLDGRAPLGGGVEGGYGSSTAAPEAATASPPTQATSP